VAAVRALEPTAPARRRTLDFWFKGYTAMTNAALELEDLTKLQTTK
jgi:hypothetical protein